MRDKMELILKKAFRTQALKLRYKKGLTQAKMAELLEMSDRAYSDIESGHYACGTLTAILLLLQMEDREEFLKELDEEFKKLYTAEEISLWVP